MLLDDYVTSAVEYRHVGWGVVEREKALSDVRRQEMRRSAVALPRLRAFTKQMA